MSHGTDKHLEHAEHVQHQAHDPFDRRVAMSMTIMAALLAGVTLASHRGHTETLRLATEAGSKHTEATDIWNFFQAKNIRSHEYQAFLFLQGMLADNVVKQDPESKAMRDDWIKQVDKYQGEGYWANKLARLTDPKVTPVKTTGDLAKIEKEAKDLKSEATTMEHKSHEIHTKVTWIDLGHLGLELALVFCAVAVLTKQRLFWFIGIGCGLLGAALAGYGIYGWWALQAVANVAASHH